MIKRIRELYNNYFRNRNEHISITSTYDWCEKSKSLFYPLIPERNLHLNSPNVYMPGYQKMQLPSGQAQLPMCYVAEISKATIIGKAEIVLTKKGFGIYDELAMTTNCLYENKNELIRRTNNKEVSLYNAKKKTSQISTGIHLCHEYSCNYFHWLLECLPKLYLIDHFFPQYCNVPILIDDDMPSQLIESLNTVSKGRKIISIKRGQRFLVDRLIYPSRLTVFHENLTTPVQFDKDVLIAPEAISYIRKETYSKFSHSKTPTRKLFVARRSTLRNLLNIDEIEVYLNELGFESVMPEKLDFQAQVKLFSEAKIIIGPSGAGMTNMLFAPSGCEIVIMISTNPHMNYYYFDSIANSIGAKLSFLLGEPGKENRSLHSDFSIDIELLKKHLKSIL